MSTAQLAAKLLGFGFAQTTVPQEVKALLARGVSSCFLFKRNIETPAQFAALLADLKRSAPGPLLTCIDQEGGRVQRLREPLTVIPPMRALGLTKDPLLAEQVARVMARELRQLNVDLTAAPVMDVDTNPANPVIGTRSLSPNPATVAAMGTAMIRGFQAEGLAACAKHFPGHGDTSQDSHTDLPRLRHSMDRLEQVELPPFKAAIDAGVATLMSAHVIFEPLDSKYPATMSRPALDGILRDRFHFQGVVFSDDLEMKAIADHYALEDCLVRGLNAGVDVFLICHHLDIQHKAIDLIAAAVDKGHVPQARFQQALNRVDKLLATYAHAPTSHPDESILGCATHQKVIDQVKQAAGQAALAVGKDPTEVLGY